MFSRIYPILAIVLTASLQAEVVNFVRPDYQNLTGPGTIEGRDPNPGLIHIQGHVVTVESAPSDGAVFLTESAYGQPFSPFIFQESSDSSTFAARVVAEVREKLYPPPGSTRVSVLAGGTAFRYKWLLFSPSEGETDVTNHFQNMDAWFGDPERAVADEQIAILRDALAVSPLDTGLRDQLLEIYYDLAVAEIQFGKKKLAELATQRLGLVQTTPFIIDAEIAIYEELVALEKGVLDKYAELLSMTMEGADPADFDDREQPGKPMGRYIFITQQPLRNATASEYATETGTEFIPDYDPIQKIAIPRTAENLVLFSGYKDFATLLKVMGLFTQHHAELARLRGMRQAPNDLTKARNAISKIQSETATDFLMFRSLFADREFPAGDASGVNAAINGMDSALAEITNVRSFLNGTANLLGLDPNFLLLVQQANINNELVSESFDILYSLLKGENQPLSDALTKQGDAIEKYQNFRSSVDRVMDEVGGLDDNYNNRFFEITGFEVGENPPFAGLGKLNSGSELDLVEQSIGSLETRNDTLKRLSREIQNNLRAAQENLTLTKSLDGEIEKAQTEYFEKASVAYDQITAMNALSAAAQVSFDTVSSIAGLDIEDLIVGDSIAVSIAGAANLVAQIGAASTIGLRERDLDFAAVAYSSVQQKLDNALTVNQANQEVGAIIRELHANTLEITDNTLALAQAQAQRNALLNEVNRIEVIKDSLTEAIRITYYADPIQYVRAENSLVLADAAFRNAQRWIFYTQRALEYKWQQKFARTETSAQGIRTFDSGTVFKLRNAAELDDLLTQLKAWNDDRFIQDSPNTRTSFVSMLDDVLAPNPNRINLTVTDRADPGVRFDLTTGQTVSQLELFRRKLTRGLDNAGNINIDFDTTRLDTLSSDFFVGPNYSTNPVAPGEWRDKIIYLKVNIIAEDGTEIPANIGGSLTYGGQTFFRTRIPPCPDRTVNLPDGTPDGVTPTDIAGEFVTAPFRYYTSPTYNNVFVAQDSQTTNITAAYTGATAKSPTGEEILADTYNINAFNQRSVAATRWRLTLFAPSAGWDLSKIEDIELIVNHRSSARLSPICN